MNCRSDRHGVFRGVFSAGALAVILCACVAGRKPPANGMSRFIAINDDSDSGIDASKY